MKILFDQSHQEFWTVDKDAMEEGQRSWSALKAELDKVGYQIVLRDEPFVSGSLTESKCNILILAAPTMSFHDKEVQEIVAFVRSGGGLLIVNDPDVLTTPGGELERWGGNPKNLTREFGFYFKNFLGSQPRVITDLALHYIWNSVKKLNVNGVSRIEVNTPGQGIASIPKFKDPCIAVSHLGKGRVLAIGDGDIFGDKLLYEEGNRSFAINTFHWLAHRNPIDIVDIQLAPEIMLGSAVTCYLTLENAGDKTLESIYCELHVPQIPFQKNFIATLPHLPGGESRKLEWSVQPCKPGAHHVSLYFKIPEMKTETELYFHHISTFLCQVPVRLALDLRDDHNTRLRHWYTDTPFRAKATVKWFGERTEGVCTPVLEPEQGIVSLNAHPERLIEGTSETYTWLLQSDTAGNHSIDVKIPETGQITWAHIWIKNSIERQIENVYTEYVVPLDAEMSRHLSLMDARFATETMQSIPFRILQFEEYAELLYPPHIVEKVREIIHYIRQEDEKNWYLLNLLISYVAPTFSANEKDGKLIGACVPCDPELTDKLIHIYPGIRNDLLFNFLFSTHSDPADIKMTMASVLANEKYGHGFFYSFTKLGQQLSILGRQGLLGNDVPEDLASSYLRMLDDEYGEVIGLIDDSSIIVREGFAAWLGLSLLQKMDSEVRLAIHQRREFIEKADLLKHLKKDEGGYFNLFSCDIPDDSQYIQGYSLLSGIAQNFGLQKAIEVVLEAADIDFGITEVGGKVNFSITPSQIKENILRNEEVRSDSKLQKIIKALFNI